MKQLRGEEPGALGPWGRLATLGPVGRIPLAPGTAATLLVGIPTAYCVRLLPLALGSLLLLVFFGISCHACEKAEQELGTQDPGQVVLDEIMGYLVSVLFLPGGFGPLLGGLVAFRVFDIWKPWPIRLLEKKVRGGVGIVLDDVLAGCYALGVTAILCS